MVKIFTTENGYNGMDTAVFIPPGDTTKLHVRLPTSYAPEISHLTLSFDTVAFAATLRWSPSKPLTDGAYALHRLVNGVEDTVILLSKDSSQYTDLYCIQFYADTLVYKLAAISRDYKEGYTRSSKPLIIWPKEGSVAKTTWSDKDATSHGVPVCDVLTQNIYTFTVSRLSQYTCGGELLHENLAKDFDKELPYPGFKNVQIGLMNNPIIGMNDNIRYSYERTLYKMDNDFNIIKRFPVPDSFFHVNTTRKQEIITLSKQGFIFFHYHNYTRSPRDPDNIESFSTTIREYDSDFNYLQSFTVNNHFNTKRVFGDTIVGVSRHGTLCSLTILNRAFTTLSSYELPTYKINIVSSNHYIISEHVSSNARDIPGGTERIKLKLFNKNGGQLGTYIVPDCSKLIYNSIDNIVGMREVSGKRTLYKFDLSFYLEK